MLIRAINVVTIVFKLRRRHKGRLTFKRSNGRIVLQRRPDQIKSLNKSRFCSGIYLKACLATVPFHRLTGQVDLNLAALDFGLILVVGGQ